MDDNDFGLALPAFNADNALVQIRRALRDLKLGERGNGFELKGKTMLQLMVAGETIEVKLAKRLSMTPEWDRHAIKSGADQRKLLDEVKRRLERWQRED